MLKLASVLLLLYAYDQAYAGGEERGARIACRAERGSDRTHWAWREIDGRRCWYIGYPNKPKHELHWPPRANEAARPREPISPRYGPLAAVSARKEVMPDDSFPRGRTEPNHKAKPAPSTEELMARAPTDDSLAWTCCWPPLEPAPVPPPRLPAETKTPTPVWALALIIITVVAMAVMTPILPTRRA
jgi:hypothetical protein